MKLTCTNCGHTYEGTIAKIGKPASPKETEKQWLSFCPECNRFYIVKMPKGKIVMAFAYGESYEYFTDEFEPTNPISSYYAFNSIKAFLEKWRKISEKPDSSWYWVLHEGFCVCTGSCDPGDMEIFQDYFAEQKKINRHKAKKQPATAAM